MMWDFPKKWLGLVAIIELYFFLFLENESECRTNAYYNECAREGDRKKGKPKISDTKEQKRTIIIDVKGAVNKEGVYEMKEGDRVKDAVQRLVVFIRSRYQK